MNFAVFANDSTGPDQHGGIKVPFPFPFKQSRNDIDLESVTELGYFQGASLGDPRPLHPPGIKVSSPNPHRRGTVVQHLIRRPVGPHKYWVEGTILRKELIMGKALELVPRSVPRVETRYRRIM